MRGTRDDARAGLGRRDFLRLAGASSAVALGWTSGCGDRVAGEPASSIVIDPRASLYGAWQVEESLPAFAYSADHEALAEAEWDPILLPRTRRHWHLVGNRAIRLFAANDGTVALFDESSGLRWVTAPDPVGTGESVLEEASDGSTWGSAFAMRAGEATPTRVFGPTWFEVRDLRSGLALERRVLCPEGEVPWVLVRVRLRLDGSAVTARRLRHIERWALRPRFLHFLEPKAAQRSLAERAVRYHIERTARGVVARERFLEATSSQLFGEPFVLRLESLDGSAVAAVDDGAPHPTLEVVSELEIGAGEVKELWFRFGRDDGSTVEDPAALHDATLGALRARLPRARASRAREASQEVPWHAAALTAGASRDAVIGGHTLNQASAYAYEIGFNGAARDPLQHALPLVYLEPDLALSVLRNTCAWATPDGDLPYGLAGDKAPMTAGFRPSDQNLWALWLAAEYAAATGDLAAFAAPLAYHPRRATPEVPLREHLRRQFRFFVDVVGRGEGGHVRILNADWNDVAIAESGVPPAEMIERGGSVLNSAMAAWVLDAFAGLAGRLEDHALEREARAQADELRALVRRAWNGRWFHRAYAPGGAPVGDADCWLEVQPWAILCGAADTEQARSLLRTIDERHRAGSPTGARLRWPFNEEFVRAGAWGDGTRGGTWYAIDMTLVWAAARLDPELAWDHWRRMTLGAHTAAYASIWEGTLSGPDSWNAPESVRAGHTWAVPGLFGMQAFPVGNLHSHAQPLLAYLRLLGVEPDEAGALRIGVSASGRGGAGEGGAAFESRVLRIDADGHGALVSAGPVVLETARGPVAGGPGRVRF